MQLAALHHVRARLKLREPLPFNVYGPDRTLLLARGRPLLDQAQLDTLVVRGAMVDLDELRTPAERARLAPREALPRLWHETLTQFVDAFEHSSAPGFVGALDEAVTPAMALVERDPDLAIFQILAQDRQAHAAYGVRRSLHAAITACLVAQRLAWQPAEVERAFKVALTMNVSMLGLQGELAQQTTAPTEAQRAQLRSHPMRSVQMLQLAQVRDPDWLRAVLQHHEVEDGSGYPSGRTDVCELASLARRADVYTSKLAARSTREALAADAAGRAMFMQDPSHPMTQALVKEFGIYPPGCLVRLASGETAVVVARGNTVTTPIVACLTDRAGHALAQPDRVATGTPGREVVGLLSPGTPRPSVEHLAPVLNG